MTEQHTPPRFTLVPAVPVVIVSTRQGDCRVQFARSMIVGPTLCAVLDAVCKKGAP